MVLVTLVAAAAVVVLEIINYCYLFNLIYFFLLDNYYFKVKFCHDGADFDSAAAVGNEMRP